MSVLAERVGDHVVRIAVPDPAALDRREIDPAESLRDALLRTADDDSVKAIILTGLGADAGAESRSVTAQSDADPRARLLYTGVRGLHQIVTYCKKVVIAAVDGACGPTASALCLDSDFVIATPTSTFASPFAIAEANVVLAVLTMRTNRTKAWMLRGGHLSADEAFTADFVNDVVARTELQAASLSLADRVAQMPLDGMTISKMNVGAAFDVVGVGRDFDVLEAGTSGPGASW